MLNKIKTKYKYYLKKIKINKVKKLKQDLIYKIASSLCKLNTKDYYHLRKGLGVRSENKKPKKMFDYDINFNLKEININYCYQIRGSLIIVLKNDLEILSFVDQTIQYQGVFFLPNDIKINCSKKKLELLLMEIKNYLELNKKN